MREASSSKDEHLEPAKHLEQGKYLQQLISLLSSQHLTFFLHISWEFGVQKICHFFIFFFLPVEMEKDWRETRKERTSMKHFAIQM